MALSTVPTAASLGTYTGYRNADVLAMDRASTDWITLRTAALAKAQTRLAGIVDPTKITNEAVFAEWYDVWLMARILDQQSTETDDRHEQKAARLYAREPKIWDEVVRAVQWDSDSNGIADRRLGRGLPRTRNVIREADATRAPRKDTAARNIIGWG